MDVNREEEKKGDDDERQFVHLSPIEETEGEREKKNVDHFQSVQ